MISKIGEGLSNAFLMAYEVWWALVLGFAISAVIQAWVPKERVERSLSGEGFGAVCQGDGVRRRIVVVLVCRYRDRQVAFPERRLGSCGARLPVRFDQSRLGAWLVLWILLGWQFALAEFVGGIVLIALMWMLARRFISKPLEEQARGHAQQADSGHQHHAAVSSGSWRDRLRSASAWSDVAHNFRGDWKMLWKEITIGFLLAGFIALLGEDFFNFLFISDAPQALRTIENVIAGPLIAILSFVCSIGNVPLAAVLWSGGISFAGVIAFIFADLIVMPIVLAYRKYYGTAFALRITALMFVVIVIAALMVDGLFGIARADPERQACSGRHVQAD